MKLLKKITKKTMALFMTLTMLVNTFLPITAVFAITQEEKNDLVEMQMRNATNIVIDGNKATITYEHGTAEITANGLKAEKDENHDFGNRVGLLWILYTSDTDILFSLNPDDGYQAQCLENGQSQSVSNNTYQTKNLQLGNSIDVEFVFETINQGGDPGSNNPTPQKGLNIVLEGEPGDVWYKLGNNQEEKINSSTQTAIDITENTLTLRTENRTIGRLELIISGNNIQVDKSDFKSNDGYTFDVNSDDTVEFYVEYINDNNPPSQNYPDDIEIEGTYQSDGLGMNINLNGVNVGGESKSIKGTAKGYATGSEKNIITIQLAFGDGNLGSVVINNQEMKLSEDVSDMAEFEVDPASKYTIVVTKSLDTSNVPRTIIWTNPDYRPSNEEEEKWASDFKIEHGYARIIEVYDENGKKLAPEEYVAENADEFGLDNGFGWAKVFPKYKVVFEFVPEYGYQLTKISMNESPMEASNDINLFSIDVAEDAGNIHFGAVFTKTDDVVKANSEKVVSGNIELGNKLDGGSAQLTVSDIELSSDKIAEFEKAAGQYTVSNYLDIDLYNVFYKGKNDADDVWSNKIDELDEYATISIKLEDGVSADDIVIVHNVHNGDKYEVIEIDSYDPDTNTITFKTKSFSHYAIATKTSNIKIEAADDTTENNSAKNKVANLLEDIVAGKTVNGISESLQNTLKEAIENGKIITVELKENSVKESDVAEDVKKVKSLIGSDSKVAGLFDITIALSIDDIYQGNVTLLDNETPITLNIPKDIPAVASGYTRKYIVVRVHDGFAEKLDTTLNNDGTLTFKTDKFSTYAITYSDSKITSNPQTGDNITLFFITLTMSIVGIIGASLILKKRKKVANN